MNRNKQEAKPRMDSEDRLAYIREQKQKLGLNDSILLKSSRRAIIDSRLHKEMPSLEFNGVFPRLHLDHTLLQPHEMFWSLSEFNKPSNIDFMIFEEEKRAMEKIQEISKACEAGVSMVEKLKE